MSKKKVLMFIGQDITAHLIMNKVVVDMIAQNIYEPVLVFPKNASSKRADIFELKEYAFFEKTILNNTVYPFVNKKPYSDAENLSPQQLADKYSLVLREVDDVNSSDFIEEIKGMDNIGCALSIRCTQIFKKDIIDVIKKGAPFMNLHSGLLPEYRGVMPTMRRMFDIARGAADTSEIGCTLHKVDTGIDTGKIIEVKSIQLDPEYSGYIATIGLAEAGADAINNVLGQLQKYTVRGYPQTEDKAVYYTFPTRKELAEWDAAGLVLFRPEEVVNTLVGAFSKVNTAHGNALKKVIEGSIVNWYQENNIVYPSLSVKPVSDQPQQQQSIFPSSWPAASVA